jgi:hypothetical protein
MGKPANRDFRPFVEGILIANVGSTSDGGPAHE